MEDKRNEEKFRWEITIPLINNKILMKQTFFLFLITYIIISILMSTIFIMQKEFEVIPKILLIFLIVCVGLFVLSILVMLIIFGNRMTLRFTLDKKGVLYEMIDTRGKKLSTLAIILGLLSKKPVTVGSGLIAKSLESIFFDFKNVLKSDFNDNKKIVFLKNEWRTLLAIYCKDENYEDVKEFINNKIREKNKEFKIEKVKNPLLKYIILSLITILASIPIFTLQYPFEINLFLPILILFFMLGAIWLTRLISVVSIGGSIYVILFIIFKLFQKRESIFFNKSYFNYELISSEDIIMFIFLSLSLIYFIGFSIYMLKGKFVSMLERDYY